MGLLPLTVRSLVRDAGSRISGVNRVISA